MTQFQKISLMLLRVSLGGLLLYAGITKVLNPAWTAKGYLMGAKTFPGLYQWFASTENIGWVNFLNEWGLTLVGFALILGIFTRLASSFGILLMLLYYLPILQFPFVGEHSFIVDEHIIYIFALYVVGAFHSGRVWGLENWCSNLPICAKFPRLRKWIG